MQLMEETFNAFHFVKMEQKFLFYFLFFIFIFVDGSLLFCRASMGDIQVIQGVLHVYEKASG